MKQLGSHWTFFICIVEVLLKYVEKIQIWLKLGKSNTFLHGELHTFITSLVTSATNVAIANNQ